MLFGFGCYQILSLNMDHFFWRRPQALPFFNIDGDCIHVLDYDYDNKPVTKDTTRLDGLVAVEKSGELWHQVIIDGFCYRRHEVILRFDTGDTTTHYVSHNFACGSAGDKDPAKKLVKALKKYIKSHSPGS